MIYFVLDGTRRGHVKIGVTDRDVNVRLQGIQTSAPGKLILLGTLPGNRHEEQNLHRRFAEFRVRPRGEWFRHEGELREFIESSAVPPDRKHDHDHADRLPVIRAQRFLRTPPQDITRRVEGAREILALAEFDLLREVGFVSDSVNAIRKAIDCLGPFAESLTAANKQGAQRA